MTDSWILLAGMLLLALYWVVLALWEDAHPCFISIAMCFEPPRVPWRLLGLSYAVIGTV